DHVSGPQAGRDRRTSRTEAADERAGHRHPTRPLERGARLRRQLLQVAEQDPQVGIADAPILDERLSHPSHLIDRDRKPISTAWPGVDERVDADHLGAEVHEGTTRVTGVDLGVLLDVAAHALARHLDVAADAPFAADDARRDGLIESEGAADG